MLFFVSILELVYFLIRFFPFWYIRQWTKKKIWARWSMDWVFLDSARQRRIENTTIETNLKRFVASYGVDPVTCTKVFVDICWIRQEKRDPSPKQMDPFLMYLCWLKTYSTERSLAGIFNKDKKVYASICQYMGVTLQP